jgi:putative inorganic carbon (HCO3(-)) transporter
MGSSVRHVPLSGRIDAVIRFFLYLLIFWLPYSPAVVEICVVLSLGLWIFKRIVLLGYGATPGNKFAYYVRAFAPPASPLNKPIFFFMFACVLSVSGSAFWEQSWHNFFSKTLEWFIVYFLVVEVFRERKHVYIALAVLGITAFSTALDSLVQFYVTHKDIFLGHTIAAGQRATAGFKTSNGLGGYLALAVPVSVSFIFMKWEQKYYRVAVFAVSFFLVWSLAVTFSRGAWLGVFCGVLFILLTRILLEGKKKFYLCLGVLFAVIVFCVIFLAVLSQSSSVESLSRHETAQWRLGIWRDSLKIIEDRPLFGHGINTFMQVFDAYRRDPGAPTYAHNCYIQVAAETGIVGLAAFLWILVDIFRKSLNRITVYWTKKENFVVLSLGLLAGVSAFLVHSFFDTDFYSLQLSVYFWFMVAVLMVFNHLQEEGYV